MANKQGRVAILLKGYPRLSETFIAQEIYGLQEAGQRQLIVSLRRPYDPATHPVHDKITAPILYLPEYLHEEPERVAAAREIARALPGYGAAYAAFRADFRRDRTRNRWRRFGQACVLATELPRDVTWLYDHYLHTPASVARYTSLMTGLPWSVSAHAKDIYTSESWELTNKLPGGGPGAAEWCVTCTDANRRHLQDLAKSPEQVSLVYHGLDLSRLPSFTPEPHYRDGGRADHPARLLSVGRAVPKKGFDVLLRALAVLPKDLHWRWTHIGKGEALHELQTLARGLGLQDRISWLGAQSQAEVFAAYRSHDLFVLPARIADDGDRDGLPNVLMEAAWHRLPILSTRQDGISELIHDGEHGALAAPEDVMALARGLTNLIVRPNVREMLAEFAHERLVKEFDFSVGLEVLKTKFGLSGDH